MLHILLSVCVVSVMILLHRTRRVKSLLPDHNYNFSIIILHWDFGLGCYHYY